MGYHGRSAHGDAAPQHQPEYRSAAAPADTSTNRSAADAGASTEHGTARAPTGVEWCVCKAYANHTDSAAIGRRNGDGTESPADADAADGAFALADAQPSDAQPDTFTGVTASTQHSCPHGAEPAIDAEQGHAEPRTGTAAVCTGPAERSESHSRTAATVRWRRRRNARPFLRVIEATPRRGR
jgi:hypothetical protein